MSVTLVLVAWAEAEYGTGRLGDDGLVTLAGMKAYLVATGDSLSYIIKC